MSRTTRLLLGLAAALLFLTLAGTVRADDDPARRIHSLAKDLHEDNIGLENYTYWVRGNIGAPIFENEGEFPGLRAGAGLPAFTFEALDGKGAGLDSAKLKGPYLLNVWASWCGPCRMEFPVLKNAIADDTFGVPIYFVNVWDTPAEGLAYARDEAKGRKDMAFFLDVDNKFIEGNLIQAIPQTILVDAEGRVQALHLGNMTDAGVAFFAALIEHPDVGAFDAENPDVMPEFVVMPEATVAPTPTATRRP